MVESYVEAHGYRVVSTRAVDGKFIALVHRGGDNLYRTVTCLDWYAVSDYQDQKDERAWRAFLEFTVNFHSGKK